MPPNPDSCDDNHRTDLHDFVYQTIWLVSFLWHYSSRYVPAQRQTVASFLSIRRFKKGEITSTVTYPASAKAGWNQIKSQIYHCWTSKNHPMPQNHWRCHALDSRHQHTIRIYHLVHICVMCQYYCVARSAEMHQELMIQAHWQRRFAVAGLSGSQS